MNDHPEYYFYFTYDDWCDLLYKINVKDERKRSALHINKIVSARAASQSDSNESTRILRSNKAKTGALRSNNSPRRAHERHHGAQRYCVLCKKAGIPERNYASHSAKDYTGVCTKHSTEDGTRGRIGSRTHSVQHHNKSEKK